MNRFKYIIASLTVIGTIATGWASGVLPWPGFKIAAAFAEQGKVIHYLGIKDVKRDLDDSEWDLLKLKIYYKKEGYEHIDDTPITLQEMFRKRKAKIKHLEQKLTILENK